MDKIIVIGTGGTIGSVKGDSIHLDKPFKILDYVKDEEVEFVSLSPFTILSENMDLHHLQILLDFIAQIDFSECKGVILLHGSDTLSFTSAVIANAFFGKPIVLVASDKPLEDKDSNGIDNFKNAVNAIKNGIDRVYVSYDGLKQVMCNEQYFQPKLNDKNVLIISPYPTIDYDNYNLDNVDTVLHTMYHSATAPKTVKSFINRCEEKGVSFYFVTENSSADYETSKDFSDIIFNSTLENAYATILLKQKSYE